jgi:hypothetical protein
MERYDMRPSLSQTVRLKAASKDGGLTLLNAENILSVHLEKKSSDKGKSGLNRFSGYFPENYTAKQMESVILKLLKGWQNDRPS